MEHRDHVALLRGAISGRVWADLGSGAGAFTLALAELLGPAGEIHSVDRDRGALAEQERDLSQRFPKTTLRVRAADFTRALDLPPLDGIVMANSLHFVREKVPALARIRGYLRPGGRFVLVEYDSDRGNTWVPYPLSFETWRDLSLLAGFAETRLLHALPSRFLGRIYSALSTAP